LFHKKNIISSTVERVIWNKMRLWLSGSKVKGKKNINGQSDVFAIQLSFKQVLKSWEFSQSDFEGLRIQPIKLWGAGGSANHMLSVFRCRPIRFFLTERSGNQIEGSYFITLGDLLFSFLHLDLWLVEKGHHLEVLFRNMGAASRCVRSFWGES